MPSPWPAIEDAMADVLDQQYGEAFEFRPQAKVTVNSRSVADPLRSVKPITGIFEDQSVEPPNPPGNDGTSPKHSISSPELYVDVRQFTAGEHPVQHDHFRRVLTGGIYDVKSVRQDGEGRLWIDLAFVKTEP